MNTLRLIFQFEQLPLSYFVKLLTLLTNYKNLRDEVRDLFLITKRFELSNLSYYRRKLALYYEVNKIPKSFFELPPPKLPLPTAYQELNSGVQYLFPLDTSNEVILLQEVVSRLKEYYKFTKIPNDYFVQKLQLPKDP